MYEVGFYVFTYQAYKNNDDRYHLLFKYVIIQQKDSQNKITSANQQHPRKSQKIHPYARILSAAGTLELRVLKPAGNIYRILFSNTSSQKPELQGN